MKELPGRGGLRQDSFTESFKKGRCFIVYCPQSLELRADIIDPALFTCFAKRGLADLSGFP